MAVHHGPDGPDQTTAAAVDDAAHLLLAVWDSAREHATVRLSWPQLNALLVIERDEGINLRGLAGRLRVILSSASRLCDRLIAAGMVERVTGRVDRREIALFLTPSSRHLLAELKASRQQVVARALAGMTAEGRAALLTGLAEFAAVAGADEMTDGLTHPRQSADAAGA
jgi:DNA-binding MarR family transcriptional regulator